MPLSASRLQGNLAPAIKSQIESYFGTPVDDTKLTDFCDGLAAAIATQVVSEITANALVNPGSFSNGAGGVTGTGTVS